MTIQNRGGRYFNQSGRVASVGIHHLDNPNWFIQGGKDSNRQPLVEEQEIREGTPKQLTDQNEGVDKNE
tara:strand:+ start:458 stop:664 length:207 start_codon:yes stop_codon:yes gene_type:complete